MNPPNQTNDQGEMKNESLNLKEEKDQPMQSDVPSAEVKSNVTVRRVPGVSISIPIVIGTIAQALKRPINVQGYDWQLTHKWCSYVRGLKESNSPNDLMEEQDLSFLIKKVDFQIHESFPEPLITIYEAPFEIHNAGYGEFPITITIHF